MRTCFYNIYSETCLEKAQSILQDILLIKKYKINKISTLSVEH